MPRTLRSNVRVEAFLADSVTTDGGKLHAVGAGWNQLLVESLPAVHGRIGLAMFLHVPAADAGVQHAIDVRFEAPDGELLPVAADPSDPERALERLEGTFQVDLPPVESAVPEQLLPLAINLDRVWLTQPGLHRFVISVDGREAASASFAVVRSNGGESG